MAAQDKIEKEGAQESGTYGEGMHEAIEDIVKAMKRMAGYLSFPSQRPQRQKYLTLICPKRN